MDSYRQEDFEIGKTILDIGYTTSLRVGKHEIMLVTEKLPPREDAPRLVSFSVNGYEKDKLVYKVQKDFTEDIDIYDASQLQRVMDTVHKEAIANIRSGEGIRKDPSLYLKSIKTAFRRKKYQRALAIAKEAYDVHPDEPTILTYYGYISAIVEKRYKEAADICERAIGLLPRKLPSGLDRSQKPFFYWHLSRVHQAAGSRRHALDAIYRGIGFDVDGGVLHKELERLGVRRKPVIPFIRRSNVVNRMLGRLRHWLKGPPSDYLEEDF